MGARAKKRAPTGPLLGPRNMCGHQNPPSRPHSCWVTPPAPIPRAHTERRRTSSPARASSDDAWARCSSAEAKEEAGEVHGATFGERSGVRGRHDCGGQEEVLSEEESELSPSNGGRGRRSVTAPPPDPSTPSGRGRRKGNEEERARPAPPPDPSSLGKRGRGSRSLPPTLGRLLLRYYVRELR